MKEYLHLFTMKKKPIWYWIGLIILVVLLVGMASCSPQRRMSRLLKKNPELIDSMVTVDTARSLDTIIIRTTNTIRETEIDSILMECTPDTVIKERIKWKIQQRCTIESLMNGNTYIHRYDNGVVKVIPVGNELKIEVESQHVNTEKIRYVKIKEPCECNKLRWLLIGAAVGLFSCIALLILIRMK